jgi:hypothetical protein
MGSQGAVDERREGVRRRHSIYDNNQISMFGKLPSNKLTN